MEKSNPHQHPAYYGGADNPFEAIKVIDRLGLGFCRGNVVKYVLRAGKKDPSKREEDLQKALNYVELAKQYKEHPVKMVVPHFEYLQMVSKEYSTHYPTKEIIEGILLNLSHCQNPMDRLDFVTNGIKDLIEYGGKDA